MVWHAKVFSQSPIAHRTFEILQHDSSLELWCVLVHEKPQKVVSHFLGSVHSAAHAVIVDSEIIAYDIGAGPVINPRADAATATPASPTPPHAGHRALRPALP